MIRVDITDQEIAAYIAEARVRRTSKYPRCDCQGDKALAKKWKKDAASDVCLFIKGQYGKEPSKLDFTDRRAMVRDCKPFLPAAKTAMLTERTGRLPRTFWADFCDDSHEYDDLTDAQALTLFKRMFPKNNLKAKKLSDIVLTESQRKHTIIDVILMSKLSNQARRDLGFVRKIGRPVAKDITPALSVSETEELLIRKLNKRNPDTVARDPNSGKIVIKRKLRTDIWRYVARRYGSSLPQKFLDLYGAELAPKKPGRKTLAPKEGLIVSVNKRAAKLKRAGKLPIKHKAPSATKGPVSQVPDLQKTVDQAEDSKLPVPKKLISTPEALNMFINNIMHKYDNTYGFSTEINRWSNPEWSMVDAYRDSISPDLLAVYKDKIDYARSILGAKSGGAYASIRENRQLAVAHVATSWLCGDLQ